MTKKTGKKQSITEKMVNDLVDHWPFKFLRHLSFPHRVFGLIFCLILALILTVGLPIYLKYDNHEKGLGSAGEASKGLLGENENNIDDFDIRWQQHLGTFIRDVNDPNYFSLASTSEKGLLKFRDPFSEADFVIFKFTPLSEDAANIIIHVNDLYEIVVGDSNFKKLTLKARSSRNGPWKTIPTIEGEEWKDMYTGIKRGTDVIMRMIGYCQMDEKYFVKLEIKFKPAGVDTSEYQVLISEYIFSPPFQECEPFDVSIGLINPKHQSGIEARFLSFEIKK